MDISDLLIEVSDKNADIDRFVDLAISDSCVREELVKQLLTNRDIMVYYHCYNIISMASQKSPELFLRYWDDFSPLLHHENSYHRDIALTVIANLTKVDHENMFQEISDDYFAHINDKKFMTARCCLQNIKKIIHNEIMMENKIIDILLNTDNICSFSDKQKELLKYDVLEIFDDIYAHSNRKDEINDFVKNQMISLSPKTKKRAKDFIEKHGLY